MLLTLGIGCSSDDDDAPQPRGPKRIDELQRISHTPRACDDTADCPSGSHCDDDRCVWQCFGDSDCGNDRACSADGECVDVTSAPAGIAADTSACLAIPVATRIATLEALADDPAFCYDDADCPCGAYCDSDATCRYDCFFDAPTMAPFCAPGQACSPEGRCIQATGGGDPDAIVDLELAPDLVQANTVAAAVVVPLELVIRARQTSYLGQAANVTVRLEIAATGAGGPLPRVRCETGAALAASCEVAAGWLFAGVDPLRSQPRTVWVELPQGTAPGNWSLLARSEWTDTPVSIPLLAQPALVAPHDTGRFTGWVGWAQPGGRPLELPVEAVVTPSYVVLLDAQRILLPTGHAIISRTANRVLSDAWVRSDAPGASPAFTAAQLAFGGWTFRPEEEEITAIVKLVIGNDPTPQQLLLAVRYAGPSALAACTADADCGSGNYCATTTVGMCLPGTPHGTYATGFAAPSAEVASAQSAAWDAAMSGFKYLGPFYGAGADAAERAYCHTSPTQTTPGRIGSSNAGTASLDVKCADNTSQQIFPFAERTSAIVGEPGHETFQLLDACLEELAIEPAPPFTAANLLQSRQCVSVARFMLGTTRPTPSPTPDPAAIRLQNHMRRQWLALHALIARGATQEVEYDEAISGQLDQPASTRLGTVVDLMAKGWRQIISPRLATMAEAERAAEQQPDHRLLGRPIAHWTFNQPLDGVIPDLEQHHPLRITNMPVAARGNQYITLTNTTATTCETTTDVALPPRSLTLMAYLGIANTTASYVLLEKQSATDYFRIRVSNDGLNARIVEVTSGIKVAGGGEIQTGRVARSIPAEFGIYSYVNNGANWSLTVTRRPQGLGALTTEYPMQPANGLATAPVWGAPGKVKLGCQIAQGTLIMDEVSLWDRPLSRDTMPSFGNNYLSSSNQMQPAVDSLPPRNLTLSPTDEQTQGLPVHELDTAAAHLQLLAAYLQSEQAALYGECGASTPGPVRTRVYDRVGGALRLIALAERDAHDRLVMAGATAAPWQPRYDAASQQIAGLRGQLVRQLGQVTRCENPLGITSEDLPLYHGEEAGSSARFFASSRFLAREARTQIDRATSELEAARSAWQQQRASAFQNAVLAPAERDHRIAQIEAGYEGVLRKLCGAPASGTLLPRFRDGTLTARNCFLKLDVPGCATAESVPVKSLPASCLRGELGEQVLAIQGADIDARNADNAYERAIGMYDAEMAYCTRREDHHAETQAIQEKHNEHMRRLRERRQTAGILGGLAKAAAGMAIGAMMGNPVIVAGAAIDGIGTIASIKEGQLAQDEAMEEEAHQLVMQARAQALDLMECFHGADTQKFAIEAAHDVIVRAYHETKGALLRLQNMTAEVGSLVDQAAGEADVERQLVRVLPHHHFWLDDHIDGYRRHLRYAKRLTYLSVRAFEYEAQQPLGADLAVLFARTPAALEQVVDAIEARTAPMQGEQGFVVGDSHSTLSLRDEILRLGAFTPPPGFPAPDATAMLRAFLKSPAARLYSGGQYLGRGIRFSLRPQDFSQFACAERIWRITTALQVDGSPVNNARLVLWQENAFGSQRCRSNERADLHVARVRPEHNLLVGDGGNFDGTSFVRPLRYTAMETTGLGNTTRFDLDSMPDGLHSGFAGRGLYANYVLLFPSLQFDNPTFLDSVRDVLIRFDIVSVTDVPGDPD